MLTLGLFQGCIIFLLRAELMPASRLGWLTLGVPECFVCTIDPCSCEFCFKCFLFRLYTYLPGNVHRCDRWAIQAAQHKDSLLLWDVSDVTCKLIF
ncbi:hypothetical protein C8J56DRAFT_122828 [Mycena floridula]|nr:hypothetical protein C8J56DRAFT_122828 [Mycena floridula]